MADGFYCPICKAINNAKQRCEHYPHPFSNGAEITKKQIKEVKDLFNNLNPYA